MAFNLVSIFGSSSQSETANTSSSSTDINAGGWSTGNLAAGSQVNTATLSGGTKNKNIGAGSVVSDLELNGSNNVVTMSDYGSVSKAIDLVMKGIDKIGTNAQQTQSQASDLLAGVLASTKQQNAQLSQAVVDTKTSDVRVLVIGALAIVGAVVAVMMKRGA